MEQNGPRPAAGKIHLFIFIHDLAPFGAQRVALQTVKNINKCLFRVTVCSFGGDKTLAPEFIACGAEMVFLGAGRFSDLSAWLRLAARLFRSRPDIIQTNLPELSFPVRLLSLFLPGLRVVHSVQNPLSSEPWGWRFLNRATIGLCDAVIFCSRGICEEAAPSLKRSGGKFFVVQNGISMETAPAAAGFALRRELGINEDEKVIGCVGRLSVQKGQDVLIEALEQLVKQKRRVRLLLAGDGETFYELKALVRRLGLEREVLFLGRRADIARILAACDVYAAASRWEGLSVALGEAMLAGRPCAATKIPGHADLLRDGITGAAVPTEDATALAGAISRLLDDPAGAQRLAAASAELVRTEFTVEKMAEKYEKLYLGMRADEKTQYPVCY
ncbi:MAG: glycosyltransferase [Elusimicrobiota bacterium]|mgnify:CR=1 FL=1